MPRLTPILLAVALALAAAGCSLFPGKPAAKERSLQAEVMEYLDAGRPKGALAAADELVATAPDDYQSYLTRNAVHLVLKDFQSAQGDNEKALSVFEAAQGKYPEQERNYRLAKIHESFALTALVASRRSADEAERKRQEGLFTEHSLKVKALDEDTWKNLRGLSGETIPE